MKLAINALRARSGGAQAHIIGIIENADPIKFGFKEIHIWCYEELIYKLPKRSWLFVHNPKVTNKSLVKLLLWEKFRLKKYIIESNFDILLNLDAAAVCQFNKTITISQDMLAFEPGEASRLGISLNRLRQIILYFLQIRTLNSSTACIFLNNYAFSIISQKCKKIKKHRIIPHGISDNFREINFPKKSLTNKTINAIYISPIWLFKHQWNVVKSIESMRRYGYDIRIKFVGSSERRAFKKLSDQIKISDPDSVFVSIEGHVNYKEIPNYLANADIFVFASSCENMPMCLIEAMSSGIPIICSNRGPMPSIIKNGAIMFDPENTKSIEIALKKIIDNDQLRLNVAKEAKKLSNAYSWMRCSNETLLYLKEIAKT